MSDKMEQLEEKLAREAEEFRKEQERRRIRALAEAFRS